MNAKVSMIVGADGQPLNIASTSPFDSAGTGRRANGWYAPGSGPNTTLSSALENLRNRSRAGYRNNPWIKQGTNALVTNEVGTGITPRSRAADPEIRSAQNALWAKHADEIDADGQFDAYGLQTLISRTRNMAGECFIRRRARGTDFGLHIPTQVQVLEPEFVPHNLHRQLPNGNRIRYGIELNRRGQREAYWMHRNHPGEHDTRTDLGSLVRVPASQVIHTGMALRPGQLRYEPVTASALLKAKTFDSYDDAELVRKESRSKFTGFIKKDYDGEDDWLYDPITGMQINNDSDGVANISVESGTWLSGLPGEDPILFNGDDTGAGYADFMRQQIMGMATSMGVPYELLSGDWTNVNDRLVRAVLHEFRRSIESIQDQLMIFQVCRRWWEWMNDSAVLSGAITLPNYAQQRSAYLTHEWRPQGWPYMHPEQDINAKTKGIAANLTSLDAEVARTGYDAEEIIMQNIEIERFEQKARKAAGLPPKAVDKNAVDGEGGGDQSAAADETQLTDTDAEDFKRKADAYGVGVRAGALTPQPKDEEHFRAAAKLPKMSAEVVEAWKEDGGTRRPITIQSGTAFDASQDQIAEDADDKSGAEE